ncbi:MAG: helix-turn-helix domain-containing protein [bacterium]|nr:helix-turn-helix domain-containing protein [bacterium]
MKKSLLTIFGIDKKTEHVYRSLLALGDCPASIVARRAGLKRTSCYHILENLIAMGLASSYKEGGVTRFVAEHPSRLEQFFQRQTILASRLVPELEKEMNRAGNTASVRIFEGREAIKNITEEALKSKQKKILSMGSTKKLIEFIGRTYGFGTRRREKGIFQRSLRFAHDSPSDSGTGLHEIRILPSSLNFPAYVLMFDNSVGITPFDEPARSILITDSAYATMMKSIFEFFWEYAKKRE